MSMMKIFTVIGARPQFIKAAALSTVVAEEDNVSEVILHTGQHFDKNMSDIFFKELNIPKPKYNLGVGGGTHGVNTGNMLMGIESALLEEDPEVVLVYGDTDSTLAAALAASKLHIPVVHVEAGLRSFNRRMPEEINRILTDHVSSLLFTPSSVATKQLLVEGIDPAKIDEVGDIMYDATRRFSSLAKNNASDGIRDYINRYQSLGLLTLHRAENVDDQNTLMRIFKGISDIEIPILFPIHPRTEKRISEFGIKLPNNIIPLEPIGYLDILFILQHCKCVLTDSGGLQKEAFFSKKPCIVLRSETEWVELVDIGANFMAYRESDDIVNAYDKSRQVDSSVFEKNIYGDGTTSNAILNSIQSKELVI